MSQHKNNCLQNASLALSANALFLCNTAQNFLEGIHTGQSNGFCHLDLLLPHQTALATNWLQGSASQSISNRRQCPKMRCWFWPIKESNLESLSSCCSHYTSISPGTHLYVVTSTCNGECTTLHTTSRCSRVLLRRSSTHRHALACPFKTNLTAVNLHFTLRPEHEARESPLCMLHCR